MCIHNISSIFTLLHPLPTSSHLPLVQIPLTPQAEPVLPSCSPFLKEKKEKERKKEVKKEKT
jgi:hypothetical protein